MFGQKYKKLIRLMLMMPLLIIKISLVSLCFHFLRCCKILRNMEIVAILTLLEVLSKRKICIMDKDNGKLLP